MIGYACSNLVHQSSFLRSSTSLPIKHLKIYHLLRGLLVLIASEEFLRETHGNEIAIALLVFLCALTFIVSLTSICFQNSLRSFASHCVLRGYTLVAGKATKRSHSRLRSAAAEAMHRRYNFGHLRHSPPDRYGRLRRRSTDKEFSHLHICILSHSFKLPGISCHLHLFLII